MAHERIKTFIAAQNRKRRHSNVMGKYFLITEHHEKGTLADHLTSATLEVHSAVLLAQSAAAGLDHLHRVIQDDGGVEKDSIAHRNITSRAFWVKDNGTFMCVCVCVCVWACTLLTGWKLGGFFLWE